MAVRSDQACSNSAISRSKMACCFLSSRAMPWLSGGDPLSLYPFVYPIGSSSTSSRSNIRAVLTADAPGCVDFCLPP